MSSAREDLSRRQLLTTGAITAASVAVSPLLLPGIKISNFLLCYLCIFKFCLLYINSGSPFVSRMAVGLPAPTA